MFYGVKCREFDEYIIIECKTADKAFNDFDCEAVFDNIDNANAYKHWLQENEI